MRAAIFTFTLLVNISAHVGFAAKYRHIVELRVLSVFSDVVQAIEAESSESWSFESNLVGSRGAAEIYPHKRNHMPEIWEKAFRYFFALVLGRIRFRSLAIVHSVKNAGNAFDQDLRPCPVISQKELLAPGKQISPIKHPISNTCSRW